mmetsp:Transcript_18103/g.41483  ORF Transcript_18103/g.41483 Transcript_18103/m.41483 type:complete len:206 (-) Transcript_18103:179-796(-)
MQRLRDQPRWGRQRRLLPHLGGRLDHAERQHRMWRVEHRVRRNELPPLPPMCQRRIREQRPGRVRAAAQPQSRRLSRGCCERREVFDVGRRQPAALRHKHHRGRQRRCGRQREPRQPHRHALQRAEPARLRDQAHAGADGDRLSREASVRGRQQERHIGGGQLARQRSKSRRRPLPGRGVPRGWVDKRAVERGLCDCGGDVRCAR